MQARIRISGAYAELHGIDPGEVLPRCLSFTHPRARFAESFRRGDWDGKVELFTGRRFPAGLYGRVVDFLAAQGREVEVVEGVEAQSLDLQYLGPRYLTHPDIEGWALREHQVEAIRAVLLNMRGVVKSPTGSGKTEMVVAAARYLFEEFGYRSLIIAPKKGIARQTAKRAELYYGGDIKVGLLCEGRREIGPITVATAQTLVGYKPRFRKGRTLPADPVLRDVVKNYEVLFFDECHRASAETWYDIGLASNAVRRYGFSGTPLVDDDLSDARLQAVSGPIIFETSVNGLIEQRFAAQPKIAMVMAEEASSPELPMTRTLIRNPRSGKAIEKRTLLPYAEAYQQGVVESTQHNAAVIRAVEWLVDRGRQTIVLCRRKEHYLTLSAMMEERGIEFLAVWGESDNSDRDHAKRLFGERQINVVLATTIWDEGEDVPLVEAVVLAEGVKISTNTLQRVGRGMRADSEEVWIVDFVPLCHRKLIEHAVARAQAYEREGYAVVVVEDWPEEDVDNLLPFLNWDAEVAARAV